MDYNLYFYDEEGNDISNLIEITKGKATPWHSSGVFTYKHPVLGDVDIGSHSSGNIILNDGYSYKIKET